MAPPQPPFSKLLAKLLMLAAALETHPPSNGKNTASPAALHGKPISVTNFEEGGAGGSNSIALALRTPMSREGGAVFFTSTVVPVRYNLILNAERW